AYIEKRLIKIRNRYSYRVLILYIIRMIMSIGMTATAKAHTNIELIKCWGKCFDELILPANTCLCVTLDGFYTKTTVEFDKKLTEDKFTLDNEEVTGEAYKRVTKYLDLIREYGEIEGLFAKVDSTNAVPTAAGFASSASGFAALAAA